MFRKFAATACLSAAIVASLAGGASAATPAGSTWAIVHGSTYAVKPLGSTWALTPVKKASIPATTTWSVVPAGVKFGITKMAGAHLQAPSSIKLG